MFIREEMNGRAGRVPVSVVIGFFFGGGGVIVHSAKCVVFLERG